MGSDKYKRTSPEIAFNGKKRHNCSTIRFLIMVPRAKVSRNFKTLNESHFNFSENASRGDIGGIRDVRSEPKMTEEIRFVSASEIR
jgi:hypothetical protein